MIDTVLVFLHLRWKAPLLLRFDSHQSERYRMVHHMTYTTLQRIFDLHLPRPVSVCDLYELHEVQCPVPLLVDKVHEKGTPNQALPRGQLRCAHLD
jgi:hypothetical protein